MRRLLSIAVAALILLVSDPSLHAAPGPSVDDGGAPRGGALRHYVLTPRRLLNEDEQADLARRGLLIQSAVAGGRYLVAVAEESTIDEFDPRIAQLVPLTSEIRMQGSALREVASGRAFVHLDVEFHDDVTFAEALSAVQSAGGSAEDVFQWEFGPVRRLRVAIAAAEVKALASDERVRFVFGRSRLKIALDNQVSAAVSKITPLLGSPYALSGAGVTLAYLELARAAESHPEFGGRLIPEANLTAGAETRHATHVGGTMVATGINPAARGMAPSALLREFDARKYPGSIPDMPSFGVAAVNNSWGYEIGWKCTNNVIPCPGWIWPDTDMYYGAYALEYTAPVDKIVRTTGVLWVHSSGNDAGNTGPSDPWFTHQHTDNDGAVIPGKTYCYSADGSGSDCPAPCSTGAAYCEVARHPRITRELDAPWLSLGVVASAKDILTVGSVAATPESVPAISGTSSRGPARDGRVKPDVVTRGVNVLSTVPNDGYEAASGTSMAAPVATGATALLTEQWRRTFGGQSPKAAALKTLILATADDIGNAGPDYTYGFGLLNAKAAADTILADGALGRRIRTDLAAGTSDVTEIPLGVPSPQDLRIVLGWTDPEAVVFSGSDSLAAAALVNDLDLKVIAPDGREVLPYVLAKLDPSAPATRGVNSVDNTEEVEIKAAAAGIYRILVTGKSVTVGSPQTFVVVANAEMSSALAPCSDPYGQFNSPANAYGYVVSGQFLNGRTCSAATANYFKFLVDRNGTVSVTVTATDTPLRVTLSSALASSVTAEVGAGETRTVSTDYALGISPTPPAEFLVKIEPIGLIGPLARYTLTPTFPYAHHAKRRSVRRH